MDNILPEIHLEKCDGCGKCEQECPTEAVALVNDRPEFTQPEACTYCGICEDICPRGAIELFYQIG